MKDLAIQKHNGDLVVATFGRGFYVFDDYVALRDLTKDVTAKDAHLFPVKPAMQYVQSRPFGGGGKAFLGESFYTADNPPVGATITYHLKSAPKTKRALRKEAERKGGKESPPPYPTGDALRAEAEEEPANVIVTITDSSGEIVRTITAPASEGLTRLTWDFRTNPVVVSGGGEGDGDGEEAPRRRRGGGGATGPMVVPGAYGASIALRSEGKTTPLAGPVTVMVLPDSLSSLKPADYAEIAQHNSRVRQLTRTLAATSAMAGDLATKLDQFKRAADLATKPDDGTRKQIADLIVKVREARRQLDGDNVLAARNENVPDSVSSRARYAASANGDGINPPTGTQLAAAADAAKLLGDLTTTFKTILDVDVPRLEKQLDAIGAPWTPGRPGK